MISFTAEILKFGSQGEKTGWTYIVIPAKIAWELFPGNKKSFRIKGKLDKVVIKGIAVMPRGDGSFIMPLNAALRKKIKKQKGDVLNVQAALDKEPPKLSEEFAVCLAEEKDALTFFESLPMSHRNYFIKWIETAKTDVTKAKRIAEAIHALSRNWRFNVMMQNIKLKAADFYNK